MPKDRTQVMAQQGGDMGILVEDSELDNLYEEWEETLPIHGLSWEIYVARIQLERVIEWLGTFKFYDDFGGESGNMFRDTLVEALKKAVGLNDSEEVGL